MLATSSPAQASLLSGTGESIGPFRPAQFQKTVFVQNFRFNTISSARPVRAFADVKHFLLGVVMAIKHWANVSQSSEGFHAKPSTTSRIVLPGVDVVREGRAEPFLDALPTLSSGEVLRWKTTRLQRYSYRAMNTLNTFCTSSYEEPLNMK
jgi:hypothetical protein